MKWPILAPDVNSTRPPSSATSVAIERLGSSRMSSDTTPSTRMNGITPRLNSRTCTPFFDASMAHQITTASRASSDGWKFNGPMSTHRRAPFSEGAMSRVNGRSGNEQEADGDEQQRPRPARQR